MEQWSENYIQMLELEIECMESNYFIPGDDCRTITTLRKQSFIILKKKNLFVIRLEETEENMSLWKV